MTVGRKPMGYHLSALVAGAYSWRQLSDGEWAMVPDGLIPTPPPLDEQETPVDGR
mgnify:CR=1 FL=1